jgi:DNA-binding MarR family transcriptional regulator
LRALATRRYDAYTSNAADTAAHSTTAPERASQTCAAGTLRRATRSVARLYDSRLAEAGLTTTQFSILSALERHAEPVSMSVLAEEQIFERTSLYRALKPLCRDGLVKLVGEAGRRAKHAVLTTRGRERIERARPHWQQAQNEFLAQFGRTAWTRLAAQLVEIADAARALPLG